MSGTRSVWYRALLWFEPLERRRVLSAGDERMSMSPAELSSADDSKQPTFEPGQLLIKLRADARLDEISPLVGEVTWTGAGSFGAARRPFNGPALRLNSVLESQDVLSAQRVFASAKHAGLLEAESEEGAGSAISTSANDSVHAPRSLSRWYRLDVAAETDLEATAVALRVDPDILYAEPNYQWRTADTIPYPIEGIPDGTTDPGYDNQWFHEGANTGFAWLHLKDNGVHPGGSRDVVVAVIDTGVDYNHEELIGNIWTNAGEIPGNQLDDDGNGFVDDIHGASVVSDGRSHSGDPIDLHGHGTHVAGIIAAQGYNHLGGVGVAFNTQIMAVRAAQYSGVLTTQDIAEAVLYAIDNGAEVINMSFGGSQRSQIVEDALAVAFNQAVLVAAAGNSRGPVPLWPGRLPYVTAVAASTPAGRKAFFSNAGDIMAPGVSIYSTLPGNQYASWSGSSMAAPVVSGVAALMRSFFFQREVYSNRFLQAAIEVSANGGVVDAYAALTEPPTPGVSMLENWLFDDAQIAADNDDDGRIDSGETVHVGVELINRGGQADDVTATLNARAPGAVMDDPYVTIDVAAVSYGTMGPFNQKDNGFVYDANGVIAGVTSPFVVTVAPDAPNDHVIFFNLTTTFYNGWDPEDGTLYTRVTHFQYIVQRGRNVPSLISVDSELTADEYWIVGGPVLVEAGVTLTIQPGTQVQWGAISDDPYNPGPQNGNLIVRGRLVVQGTAAQPVNLFPSPLVAGQRVAIQVEAPGSTMQYATVRNPSVTGFESIDHAYLDWDSFSSAVRAGTISNTTFHKFRGGGTIEADTFDTVQFDSGWIVPAVGRSLLNSVVLQDNENVRPLTFGIPPMIDRASELFNVQTYNGHTYAMVEPPCRMTSAIGTYEREWAEPFADYFGGDLLAISDLAERDFITGYLYFRQGNSLGSCSGSYPNYFVTGLVKDLASPQGFDWSNGEALDPTVPNWRAGYPASTASPDSMVALWEPQGYSWYTFEPTAVGEFPAPRIFFLLEFPQEIPAAQILAANGSTALMNYLRDHTQGNFRFNAFLNRYWDLNVNNWMRFVPTLAYPDAYAMMRDNYWGTDTTTLIDHAIIDFRDNFTTPLIDYGVPPTGGYATAYPHVDKVWINDLPADSVPSVGSGPTTFRIHFNRDMDTSVMPFVSFGPSIPYTDFLVEPIDNGWLDVRTWEGTFYVTPVTGEGYHLMRISGAVAADDPWLVSGEDTGRFRFQVQTVTTATLGLQATGVEGGIQLSWAQDEFDLLAGYNLYRSATIDGPYERLNDTIIPVGTQQYVDTDVQPAVPMFYRFTVVQTDLLESAFSNIASAAALDTIPPAVTHVPAGSAVAGRGLRIEAEATDNVDVTSVTLHFRAQGGAVFNSLSMVNITADQWSATIPGSAVVAPAIEYYLFATDGISQAYSGTPAAPHTVVVTAAPSLTSVTPNQGSAQGGTAVTLAGTLFQPGASVLFGGQPAGSVVVLSENQITAVTPSHFPALVDVQIVNPDASQATLLSGFRYLDTGVVLSLPSVSGDYGGIVEIPLSAANLVGLRAADLAVTFDSAVLHARSARLGNLTPTWAFSANVGTPGTIQLSLAGATSVSGTGDLAYLSFDVVAPPPAQSALSIVNPLLNDGAITGQLSPGLFNVNGLFALAGTVSYFSGGPVPGVSLALNGAAVRSETSDENGAYSLVDLPVGAYTLTPNKSDGAVEITAFDASLVLQAAAGLASLSPKQRIAADVNRNSLVTAFDAAYILEKSVELLTLPFPGAGRTWDFTPASRTYSLLNSDQSSEDFVAVLLGDVSGNWTAAAAGMGSAHQGTGVQLSMPQLQAGLGQRISMPISLTRNEARVYAADLVLTYDPATLSVAGSVAGNAAAGMALAVNSSQPGTLRIGLAGAVPLDQDGTLVELLFDVVGPLMTPSTVSFTAARINEGALTATATDGTVSQAPSSVVDRRIFYNNSQFDGNNAAANASDDAAIATDKVALLPGGTATFANYTSFSKSTGLMVDIQSPSHTLTISDFAFRTGNNNAPGSWAALSGTNLPAVTVRPGAGAMGSDRYTLIFPANSINKRWLQVTVLTSSGLASPDVFYFGNAVGESGNSTTDTVVNATDEIGARTHPVGPFPTGLVTNLYDFNRDRLVNATDQIIARTSGTNPLTALRLIAVPAETGSGALADVALLGLADERMVAVVEQPARRRRR